MTPDEAVRLVHVITRVWPHARLADGTPQAWWLVLQDVPYPAAEAAVLALARRGDRYPDPGVIRRWVAEQAGLTAPDADQAWLAAYGVASREGEGRRQLHPAVRAAYDAAGGAWGLTRSPNARRAFDAAYAEARARHDNHTLEADMHDQLTDRLPVALGGGRRGELA